MFTQHPVKCNKSGDEEDIPGDDSSGLSEPQEESLDWEDGEVGDDS